MNQKWKGKWALVTGGSSGIGVALAKQLAAGGTHVVLTARRRERLEELAQSLHDNHGIQAEVFAADLARPEAPREIYNFTKQKGIEIDLLINNAGFGQYGELTAVEPQRLLDMVARRRGDVLILASTASFQAVPYISTYAATKAFDLLFAEGLAEEMKPYGIRVCALCPGSTQSEFHVVAGQEKFSRKDAQETAEKVARTGLQALADGKSYVISGMGNYWGAQMQRLVPRRAVVRVAAKMFRPEKARRA